MNIESVPHECARSTWAGAQLWPVVQLRYDDRMCDRRERGMRFDCSSVFSDGPEGAWNVETDPKENRMSTELARPASSAADQDVERSDGRSGPIG